MALFPWPHFLQKSWHPNRSTLGIRASKVNFEGQHKNTVVEQPQNTCSIPKGRNKREGNNDESHASLIHSMANSMKLWSPELLFSLTVSLPDPQEWPFCLWSSAERIVCPGLWMVLPSFQWYFLTTIWDLIRMTSTIHISTFSHGFCCIL